MVRKNLSSAAGEAPVRAPDKCRDTISYLPDVLGGWRYYYSEQKMILFPIRPVGAVREPPLRKWEDFLGPGNKYSVEM
jgi:hypothetical protein